MSTPRKNGPNPCKTQPGEVRSVRYQPTYTSAQAAAFANVPESTVYRARRLGQLPTVPVEFADAPHIAHDALLAWMASRGFPVPREAAPPAPLAPMTPYRAGKVAGVPTERIVQAIHHQALRALYEGETCQPRIEQAELERWIAAGKPVSGPAARPHTIEPLLPAFIARHHLDPKLLALHGERLGLDRSFIPSLLRGELEQATLHRLARLLGLLSQAVGRPVELSEIYMLGSAELGSGFGVPLQHDSEA